MSAKAIYFVFLMLVFALFSGFNLDHKVDISLGFYLFKQIPVFLVSIFSFLIGCFLTIPFFFKSSSKASNTKKEKKSYSKKNISEPDLPPGVETVELKGEKKSWFKKLKSKKADSNDKNDAT